MPTPLKDFYSDDYITHIAGVLAQLTGRRAENIRAYVWDSSWDQLSLKARMNRLTEALIEFLPNDYEQAIGILKHVLPRISGGIQTYDGMLTMFVPDYIAQQGLDHWDLSMEALAFCTSHGTSSEMAIRPFIQLQQERAFIQLHNWAHDANPHIRRLASEGCRPRLPWATALVALKKDPSPIVMLLDELKQDDSLYVRKSVANNLNDISKDHPELLIETVSRWYGGHPHTNWIVKHASRTLLKRGNQRLLTLFGASDVEIVSAKLIVASHEIKLGDFLEYTCDIVLKAENLPSIVRLEYGIDFRKSSGKQAQKIFKMKEIQPENGHIKVKKRHLFKDYTTRKHYAGRHKITLFINGKEACSQEFELVI